MHPIEVKALAYINRELNLAAEFARLGKRGLHDYHAELAESRTLDLLVFRQHRAAMLSQSN